MKLNEKIIVCRKQKGYSQEELASLLGVSRQSISKWETGESLPDINKLMSIAKVFDVTTDWLLTEDDIVTNEENTIVKNYPSWLDKLPSNMLKMVRKFGWLYGLYLAGGGVATIGVGCLARFMFKTMILGDMNEIMNNFVTGDIPHHVMEGIIMDSQYGFFSSFELTAWKMASTFTGFIIGLGILTVIAGLMLAVVLKKWGNKELSI